MSLRKIRIVIETMQKCLVGWSWLMRYSHKWLCRGWPCALLSNKNSWFTSSKQTLLARAGTSGKLRGSSESLSGRMCHGQLSPRCTHHPGLVLSLQEWTPGLCDNGLLVHKCVQKTFLEIPQRSPSRTAVWSLSQMRKFRVKETK